MKFVVCGGSGFIGRALVRVLSEREGTDEVLIYSRRDPEFSIRGNLSHLNVNLAEHFHPGDFKDAVVFDLAAKVFGVRDLFKNPATVLTDNIAIASNVARACAQGGARKLVYVSSSCVYDFEGAKIPHDEDDMGMPRAAYAQSKRFGELIAAACKEEFGLDYAIARPFNVYGPGEWNASPHVIPEFFRKAWEIKVGKSKTFEILGAGLQVRAFTYVGDVAEGLARMGERGFANGKTINLSTDETLAIGDLADRIMRLVGVGGASIDGAAAPAGDSRYRGAMTEKAKRILDWTATMAFGDGLRKTWEWLEPRFEAGGSHA